MMGEVFSVPEGQVIAMGVSAEEYMEKYAADFCEWVSGVVIKMSPIHEDHDMLTRYLATLFSAYFELKPIGTIRQGPFVQRLGDAEPRREPDIQIILNTNPGTLTETYMDGPADICIEVVSPESVERDHGTKLAEYERGGVSEYWIIDPIREETRFYRLNDKGVYIRQEVDAQGYYRTSALPGFKLHVPTLWQDSLPGAVTIVETVKAMLGE